MTTSPMFFDKPDNQWTTVPASSANTAKDGTGTVYTAFTASVDTYIRSVRFMPLGTNVASVGRVFLNNGSTSATAANNTLIGEKTLPATTVNESQEQTPVELPIGIKIASSHKINVCVGTAVAAGFAVQVIGENNQ